MKSVIYYFSATGNSLFVAKELALSLNAQLISIASLINKDTITLDSHTIGFVFPIYYNRIPVILNTLLNKAIFNNNTFIYYVCTYGGGPGESKNMINTLLQKRGAELSASFGIHMPQNSFYKPWENVYTISKKAENKIHKIAKRIITIKPGMLFSDILLTSALFPINLLVRKPTIKALAKISDSPLTYDLNTLIYLADKGYSINSLCNGCGICSKVCPVNNIKMIDNKPFWLNHCENCIACYNWCPNKAIVSKIVHNGYYYKHPYIKVTEIIQQKNG